VKFWDSSAVVPLLVQQSASAKMDAYFRQDPTVIVWWGTKVECDSAIARMEREHQLEPPGAAEAFRRLDVISSLWHEVQPVDVLRESARRMLRLHSLRAADCLQLAAAFMASENRPSTLEFVCLDERLAAAAEREGLQVLGLR
jgi:predicted nucleic acid-binding protein